MGRGNDGGRGVCWSRDWNAARPVQVAPSLELSRALKWTGSRAGNQREEREKKKKENPGFRITHSEGVLFSLDHGEGTELIPVRLCDELTPSFSLLPKSDFASSYTPIVPMYVLMALNGHWLDREKANVCKQYI